MERWEYRNINQALFLDLVNKWIRKGKENFANTDINENILDFDRMYKDVFTYPLAICKDKLLKLYHESVLNRSKFSYGNTDSSHESRIFLWLSDDQMNEWKQALIDQGVLVIN